MMTDEMQTAAMSERYGERVMATLDPLLCKTVAVHSHLVLGNG